MLLAAALTAGCTGGAPALPRDTTSITAEHLTLAAFTPTDAALTCDQIAAERARTAAIMTTDEAAIAGNRTRNQAAAYVAGLSLVALPALAATEANAAERKEINSLYERRDLLISLAGVKACPQVNS